MVMDSMGLIMELALDRSPAHGPALPFATAIVGRLGERWAWGFAPMRAQIGRAGLRIKTMSLRFGFHLGARPSIALASRSCNITFPNPALIR